MAGCIGPAMPLSVSKKAAPFLTRGDRGLRQRTRCPLSADSSHVCRPKCIFSGVHAAGENDLIRFRFCGSGTLRGLFDSLRGMAGCIEPAMPLSER